MKTIYLATAVILLVMSISTLASAYSSPQLVNPKVQITKEGILFQITYISRDNIPPVYVSVFVSGVEYKMEQVDPNDKNYTDGALFQVLVPFAVFEQDPQDYYFKASDGVTVIKTGIRTEPIVGNVGPPY
jgi:hypothetical protein